MDTDLTLILDSLNRSSLPLHYRRMDSPYLPLPGAQPSRLGLDQLRASGSHQFSALELTVMLADLPAKPIIVDLRQESHGFLNGAAVSWYSPKDFANLDKNLAMVEADENARLKALSIQAQTTLTEVLAKDLDGHVTQSSTHLVPCDQALNEAQVAAGHHVPYWRLAVTDHTKPSDPNIDDFLRFYRELPANAWLHLHCHAGEGRTTTFLVMVDLLANANSLSAEDIASRQHWLGGLDLLNYHPAGWKTQPAHERADFIRQFHRYAAQNPGARPQLWSEWLEKNR